MPVSPCSAVRSLVALLAELDLLLFAKRLFGVARTRQSPTKNRAGMGAAAGMSQAVRRGARRVMLFADRGATNYARALKRITGLPVPRRGAIRNGSSAPALSRYSAACKCREFSFSIRGWLISAACPSAADGAVTRRFAYTPSK